MCLLSAQVHMNSTAWCLTRDSNATNGRNGSFDTFARRELANKRLTSLSSLLLESFREKLVLPDTRLKKACEKCYRCDWMPIKCWHKYRARQATRQALFSGEERKQAQLGQFVCTPVMAWPRSQLVDKFESNGNHSRCARSEMLA